MNHIRNIDYGIKKIEEHFSSFLNSGFHIIKSSVDEKGFGNWAVVLQSKECLIKFIHDRGYISVVIGPHWASEDPFDLKHFLDLYLLIDFNNKKQSSFFSPKYDTYDIDKSLHDMSITLKKYLHDLVLILTSKDFLETEKAVKDYNLQRLRRIYPNIK
jgi:hypothetical protein